MNFSKVSMRSQWVAYRALATITWTMAVTISIFAAAARTEESRVSRIWHQNESNITAFTIDEVISCIFWVIIFGFQLYFLLSLFHNKLQLAPLDRCVCNYFSFNNMLHCAFVIFFIESRFIEAEVILALNFVNLMVLYIRHPEMSLIAHLATISGPLSWTCVALYWNGAITTSFSLTSFIVSNTLIWGLLLYGLLFLIAYDDYTISYCLSVLLAAIGTAQVKHQSNTIQWVFPFIIMGLLFTAATAVALMDWRHCEKDDERKLEILGGDAESQKSSQKDKHLKMDG